MTAYMSVLMTVHNSVTHGQYGIEQRTVFW